MERHNLVICCNDPQVSAAEISTGGGQMPPLTDESGSKFLDYKAAITGRMKIDPSQVVAISQQHLVGADFSGKKLLSFASAGSTFKSCSFEKIRIESASLGSGREMSEYLDCTFDGSKMKLTAGGHARFVHCSFRNFGHQRDESSFSNGDRE
jgi:hypothetical protein